MAPTYKVEELLAVRGSVSESAVSLERFADEDAIKEHVLRPSASTSRIGQKSDSGTVQPSSSSPAKASPQVTSTRKLAAFTNSSFKSSSPSPSIKRAKIERLIKEHGSPPGRRVTAGGRIVPTNWAFGYAPTPYGNCAPFDPWMRPYPNFFKGAQRLCDFPNGFVGYNIDGKPCQIVDSEMRELKDGRLFMAAPNVPLPVVQPTAAQRHFSDASALRTAAQHSIRFASSGVKDILQSTFLGFDKMPCDKQIQYLTAEMKRLKDEHNGIERQEVVQEGTMTAIDRAKLVDQKKDLVIAMDRCRRIKKGLEEIASGSGLPMAVESSNDNTHTSTWVGSPPLYNNALPLAAVPDGFVAHEPAYPHFEGNAPYPFPLGSLFLPPDAIDVKDAPPYVPTAQHAFPGQMHTQNDVQSGPSVTTRVYVSPDSAGKRQGKRSHAIEIKPPPEEELKTATKYALDPTSPTYEPCHVFVPPSPSPIGSPVLHPVTQNTWLGADASLSSVSTTNFFPNDAAEHSQRKHTFLQPPNAPHGAELSAFSGQIHTTTPQKDWIRNAQTASQAGSPDANGQLKAPPVSPVETRMSSWTRDILPSLQPASVHGSPDVSRANAANGANGTHTTPQHPSRPDTPIKVANIFHGKSNDWCQGYLSGMGSAPAAQPDPLANNDFKAGFYQGLVDAEKKTISHQTTPEKSNSHSSSQNSVGIQIPNAVQNNVSGFSGPAQNLPFPIAHTAGPLPSFRGGPVSYPSQLPTNVILAAEHIPRFSTAQAPKAHIGDVVGHSNGQSGSRIVSQAVNHDILQRSPPQSMAVKLPTPRTAGNIVPFTWKDDHLRQQQIASLTGAGTWAPSMKSGNQLATGNRVTSSTFNSKRIYPTSKTFTPHPAQKKLDPIGTRRRANVSQVDGASDDLAELDPNFFKDFKEPNTMGTTKAEERSDGTPPSKDVPALTEGSASKPNVSKKPNLSPSKAKEVTNRIASKVRRVAKGAEDPERSAPSQMDPAQKEFRRSQWRKRFQNMKKIDRDDVKKNRADLGLP